MADAAKTLADLRKPFPKGTVGKLPKPYKKDSPKGDCKECGKYHALPALHVDFVGHAAVTDRLLEVDPNWSWEPMATDEDGIPKADRSGNLWIRLTVLGVTRIGVGDGNNAKECIGDALRNAAMRFGVALDLWSKEELESVHEGTTEANEKPTTKAEPAKPSEPEAPADDGLGRKKQQILKDLNVLGYDTAVAKQAFINTVIKKTVISTEAEADEVLEAIRIEKGEE